MNKELAVKMLGFMVGAGITSLILFDMIVTERMKARRIQDETIAENNALLRAARYVMDGITDGDYEHKPEQIMIDYEFVKIVERID